MVDNLKLVLFFFVTLFLISFGLSEAYAGKGSAYNNIVFFGDSLTDNGNLSMVDFRFFPKSPPYFEGQFSNGSIWAELLAEHFYNKNFTQSSNYAVGGETAIFHNPTDGFLPYSLAMSVDLYLLRTVLRTKSSTLFIIWVGANDYLQGSGNPKALTTPGCRKH